MTPSAASSANKTAASPTAAAVLRPWGSGKMRTASQPLRCSSWWMSPAWEALVTTARRSGGIRGSSRATVACSKESDPNRRSTCLGYSDRLNGQNRVPVPPARMTP
jgi:hypothetical protein